MDKVDEAVKKGSKRMPPETLLQRLRTKPTHEPGYVYHVTRGVHLANIKRSGLIAQDKSEYHYASKKNWFASNLTEAYELYGSAVIRARYRFTYLWSGQKFAEKYFQGVAVLRCTPKFLFSKNYTIDLRQTIVGEKRLGPQSLELFIDGQWTPLNRVELKWSLWPIFYKCTRFLRVRP